MRSIAENIELVAERAKEMQIAIVSVGYRLAPENPYPAGVDDCEAGALWLAKNCAKEFGTTNLALGGESAGAHLSVMTLLRLRDNHNLCPFKGVVLQDGTYDFRLTPSARTWGRKKRKLVLTYEILEQLVKWYAPNEDLTDPDISPIFADLDKMPSALFLVGSQDFVVDDTLFMEARWRLAGNKSELLICPGGSHWFAFSPTPVGDLARASIYSFISKVLQD